MKTKQQQRASLEALMRFAKSPTPGHCNFGAMVLLEPQYGDVSFLAPIAQELRGVEIVSALPARSDGRDYDIWKKKKGSINPDMIKSGLTKSEVVEWLQAQCQHSEADYMQHGAKWLEDVMTFYGAQR